MKTCVYNVLLNKKEADPFLPSKRRRCNKPAIWIIHYEHEDMWGDFTEVDVVVCEKHADISCFQDAPRSRVRNSQKKK